MLTYDQNIFNLEFNVSVFLSYLCTSRNTLQCNFQKEILYKK